MRNAFVHVHVCVYVTASYISNTLFNYFFLCSCPKALQLAWHPTQCLFRRSSSSKGGCVCVCMCMYVFSGGFNQVLILSLLKMDMGSESVARAQDRAQVLFSLEALAKGLYERLFLWLVFKINQVSQLATALCDLFSFIFFPTPLNEGIHDKFIAFFFIFTAPF